MDFKFTEEQEKFRQEVRDFIEEELMHGSFKPMTDGGIQGYETEFTKNLAQKGWIGLTWPKEYGGQERSWMDRLILTEELLRYGAPAGWHWSSDRQMGPSIIKFGTEEQKKEFLPKIIRGEISMAIGMSEPEAGSDMASLQTRAVEDGDDYVIDGQKVWTGGAHYSNYIYLVVRTDPSFPPHDPKNFKGISEFIVPTNLPGITIKPMLDIAGREHFTEIFFDNARVPKRYLVGEKNRGFYQIMEQLDYERAGIERLMSNYVVFAGLIEYAKKTYRNGKPLSKEPLIRDKLAELQVEFEVGRLLIYRVAWVLDQGRAPNYEAAIAKIYCTDFEKRLANEAIEILGLYGQLMPDSKYVPLSGKAILSYLFSPGYTIQAGTSEILRNVIAQRGLGLPRE